MSSTTAREAFVELAEAARQQRCHVATIRRRLRRQGVPLYRDPHDWRARLIRREDMARLVEPTPVTPVLDAADPPVAAA